MTTGFCFKVSIWYGAHVISFRPLISPSCPGCDEERLAVTGKIYKINLSPSFYAHFAVGRKARIKQVKTSLSFLDQYQSFFLCLNASLVF